MRCVPGSRRLGDRTSSITILGAMLTLLYGIQTTLNIGRKIGFYKELSGKSNNLLIELQTKPSTEDSLEKNLKSFQELQVYEAQKWHKDTIQLK